MSDIVERLRSHANWYISCALGSVPEEANDELEAADEITRIRSELANARNTALEDAAKIADTMFSDTGMYIDRRDAAKAIRALKAEGESHE